jgi:dienelactone hydrolase
MRRLPLAGIAWLLVATLSHAQDLKDKRLTTPPISYNEKYYHWAPPATKEAWEARRPVVREQLLVSQGLWPMPEKSPLNPVIHGKIERDGYAVEKVFFASVPGHYVTGNLYRPTGKTGKLPAVLCPHGHWANGRLYEAKDWQQQMKSGAEETKEGALYPLQARCAQLARLGCVVFFYDMVGVADSTLIGHRLGFKDADAELRLHNFMGLQTWNSVRALDFILGLPEVDVSRVGITGASGGGTQSFILAAFDDRLAASFPAVMVSTSMQGGCVCENSSYLRVGTTNIELAALAAPRPMGMSCAQDWTVDMEKKGLPELKAIYKMYGVEENVTAKFYKFPHNYNQVAREMMYDFFNQHLKLGATSPIKEKPFTPVAPKELSVFDAEHPQPKDAASADALRRTLTMRDDKQFASLLPKDAATLKEFQKIEFAALRAMMTDSLATVGVVEERAKKIDKHADGYFIKRATLSRKDQGEAVPVVGLLSKDFAGHVVVWVHPDGVSSLWKDGKLVPAAQEIIDKKGGILAVEAFRTGATAKEPRPDCDMKVGGLAFSGYYFGYNRSLVADRVRDILTGVKYIQDQKGAKQISLVGFEKAGPWVVLARGLCGDAVQRTAADLNQFRFEQVKDVNHEMMMPGGLKYGGVPSLAGVIAPNELYVHNTKGTGSHAHLRAAYQAAGHADRLVSSDVPQDAVTAVRWLLR